MRAAGTLDHGPTDALSTMPGEVIETMLQFLDEPGLCSVATVNQAMHNTVRHANKLWYHRYAKLWQGRRLGDPFCPLTGGPPKPEAALACMGASSWQQACLKRRRMDVTMLRNWGRGQYRCRIFSGHENEVFCLLRKGELLLTGSQDNTIRVWDVRSAEALARWTRHESWVSCLALDTQRPNTIFSGAHDGTIRTWDLHKFESTSKINFDAVCTEHGYIEGATGNHRYILSIEPMPVELSASTYLVGTMDRAVRLVDMRVAKVVGSLCGHDSYVSCLLPIEGTAEIVTGSGDTRIRYWDARTMRCTDMLSFHTAPVTCLKRRDGELISSSEDGRLKYWRQNKVHTTYNNNELWGFDMNERVLVAGCECGRLEVRNAVDGALRYVIHGHAGPVGSVHVEDDLIVTGSEDSLVKLWEFDHAQEGPLPEDVHSVLPPDAPLGPAHGAVPTAPARLPFMPDNLNELAAQVVRANSVAVLQQFLTNLGFNSQCPPEAATILAVSRALAEAMNNSAAELGDLGLEHFGPDASAEHAMALGPGVAPPPGIPHPQQHADA